MTLDIHRLYKVVLLFLGLGLLLCTAVEFLPELWGLGWHAIHGTRTRLDTHMGRRYSVQTPLFMPAMVDEGGWDVSVFKKPGPIRARLGDRGTAVMTFSAAPMYSTAQAQLNAAPRLKGNKYGLEATEVASVSTGGGTLRCFRNQTYGEILSISCAPESDKRAFSATFLGSAGLLPEFYGILKSVSTE